MHTVIAVWSVSKIMNKKTGSLDGWNMGTPDGGYHMHTLNVQPDAPGMA